MIEFDSYITDVTVQLARRVLDNPRLAEEMAEQNYQLAKQYWLFGICRDRRRRRGKPWRSPAGQVHAWRPTHSTMRSGTWADLSLHHGDSQ